MRWLPWKWIVRRAARAYGVIDPLTLAARMRRFSQPSEVAEPLELLRAGIVFHARGLVNTKAIQHNLDWVWPYWVTRQFDPGDASFVPRAFSFSHVNLTHRNWTAVGLPDCPHYPIVDPCGLFTPLHDGWSIDCWLLRADGDAVVPSRMLDVDQQLELDPTLAVHTRAGSAEHGLRMRAEMKRYNGRAHAVLSVEAHGDAVDSLAVAIRPYNPEGIQFVDRLSRLPEQAGIRVNDRTDVILDPAPDTIHFATYTQGDVFHALPANGNGSEPVQCSVGMATGAGLYRLGEGGVRHVQVIVPLEERGPGVAAAHDWTQAHAQRAALECPDARLRFLFEAARSTLVLHSVDDVVPGPYTYRRFWFRDACLIVHALLAAGYRERARQALARFPERQRASGYFQSQEGEWDSNGQVLWIYGRFQAFTGETLPSEWVDAIERGVRWIRRKRMANTAGHGIAGLLPAGFSAEHLGPNDYYYWDDWWALAGLREAANVLDRAGRTRAATRARDEAHDLRRAINASLASIPPERCGKAIPAAPYRRMDAGAIGSLVADYPLRETPAGDRAIMATVEYLMKHSFHAGGFFQNMIHSGINAYLTLDIAQTLLRAGQPHRAWPLIRKVADLATATGQWPEAIHPQTAGGCMGDGQHVWAAAEWLMAMRALFVREEGQTLVIGSGLPPEWLEDGGRLAFGPTGTPWGPVTVELVHGHGGHTLRVEGQWHEMPPRLRSCVPGYRETDLPADGTALPLDPLHR